MPTRHNITMRLVTVVLTISAFAVQQNNANLANLKSAINFAQNVIINHEEVFDKFTIFRGIKSLLVNDRNVDIRYWNSYYGNDSSFKINYGYENEILQHWITGLPLKVIIHGWLDSMDHTDGVHSIKRAYVDVGGFNVLSVNWGGIAGNKSYMWPVIMASTIGTRLARVLENIVKLGMVRPEDVHVIGHSLGAHIAGMCGASFQSGKIGRITGLDPAGPGFEFAKFQKKGLHKEDAIFVDVIHTAAGSVGYFHPLGHADFYPNSGRSPQPGCDMQNIKGLVDMVGCSHSRAYRLYEDSVYNAYSMKAVQCTSWSDYVERKCDWNYSTPMGHGTSPEARGNFYLRTRNIAPFDVSEYIKEDL